jgi:hypothetical protein
MGKLFVCVIVAAGMLIVLPGTALAASAPVPPTSCTIARLPEPKDSELSIVTAADPTGRFVAGRGYPADGDAGETSSCGTGG